MDRTPAPRAQVTLSGAQVLLVYLMHVIVWIGLVYLLPGSDRVSFEFLGADTTPWVRQFVLPLLAVLAFQVALLSRLGWWGDVLRDPSRTSRQWLWVPLVGLIGASWAFSLALEGFTDAGWSYVLGVAATVLLVGACEELAFRGYLLVACRRLFAREWHAVAATSVLFGLFHLPNALLGSPMPAELLHVVQTAVLGLMFYALRRLSGSILVPVLVHAVWDFVVLQSQWDVLSL